jgi:hypothetical protein
MQAGRVFESVMARMMSGLSNSESRRTRTSAGLAIAAAFGLLLVATGPAGARGGERAVEAIQTRNPGEPVLAVVSLQRQRITVYDAQGWILRAPVSSGQRGRETPSGIFSIIQKEAEHYSNLYDDAFMPHMQRLTWSGIALHGGSLPGYPASHGCVRMPYDFAERLFDVTQLGLRVIVAPGDAAPVEIDHPLLFRPKPGAADLVTARNAEAAQAAMKANQARLAAGTAFRDSMQAMVPVRTAETLKYRADQQLAAAEVDLAAATSDDAKQKAEDVKAKAAARVDELQAQLAAAKAELQPKIDTLKAAREAAVAAEAAQAAATEAVRQVARASEPVSVLISRKTQRLYVRQGFEPVFDSPVTITDPDRPIGTHVFTAMARTGGDSQLKWSVVSLDSGHMDVAADEPRARMSRASQRDIQPTAPTPDSARAALDRITIPQDALDRIPGIAPRSSLIVTDEGPSSETGKGTDFVIVLSDAPQGGIKFRRRAPATEYSFAPPRDRFWVSPGRGFFSSW